MHFEEVCIKFMLWQIFIGIVVVNNNGYLQREGGYLELKDIRFPHEPMCLKILPSPDKCVEGS